jgi:hypothetical protein
MARSHRALVAEMSASTAINALIAATIRISDFYEYS